MDLPSFRRLRSSVRRVPGSPPVEADGARRICGSARLRLVGTAFLALTLAPAWGAAQDSGLVPRSEVARILAIEGADRHEEACEILRSGVVREVLEVEEELTYRPMQFAAVPHAVCLASWDVPDKEELEAACAERMMAHSNRRVQAMLRREDFDEPMPTCPPTASSVSVTLVHPVHDSAAEAVASLESAVGRLAEGIDFEVRGEEHTARMVFDSWVDGVGDRAAWSTESRELQVASGGVRFGVSVQVHEDPEEDRALAIELARRIAG